MIKAIYNLEPQYEVSQAFKTCEVSLAFEGKNYYGYSYLAPEDEDFFSEKVGLNIALSRARISLLESMIEKTKTIADTKYQIYHELSATVELPIEIRDKFLSNITKAQRNCQNLRTVLKKEKKYLRKYLENQDKMVERIKLYREKKAKEE